MDTSLYQQFYQLEKSHWWFRGRRNIITSILSSCVPDKVESALDIGCGTGFNAALLKKFAEKITGVESSDEAITFAEKVGISFPLIKGEFPLVVIKEQYDLISLLDVLEHIDDERQAAQEIERLLKPGGIAVITVPAFPFLWSEHDTLAHHKRRYTQRTLMSLFAAETQCIIEKMSYYNFFLFLPIVTFRFMRRIIGLKKGESDIFSVPHMLNEILYSVFSWEHLLIRHLNFPIGISLICVVRKPYV